MKLTFYGSTGIVTGSCTLLETEARKFLIDCGLFQGEREWEAYNHKPLPFEAASVDAVFITHAHLDHCGRLPHLVKAGFRGKIYGTAPTLELVKITLEDALHLMEYRIIEHGWLPDYSVEDVARVIAQFSPVEYRATTPFHESEVIFHDAGHILGSSIIEIKADGKIIAFSGDLGNPPVPLLHPTEYLAQADVLVMESTYGDREHDPAITRVARLERSIEQTVRRRGTILIPSFAIERTQEVLYELNDLVENGKIPRLPVFVDSPLATRATEIYRKYAHFFNPEAAALIKSGDDVFHFPGLQVTSSVEESKKINAVPAPKIIIAGSGMMNGGRILHHAKRVLPDPNSTLLIISYQAQGTLGRQLVDGADPVLIHGERIPVRASIECIHGYSAHADQPRLLDWVDHIERPIQQVFCIHGESGAPALAQLIRDRLGIMADVPEYGKSYEI